MKYILLWSPYLTFSFFRYEAAFNGFVDEINAIAAYQWWEGAIYIMLSVLVYPLAWSWQQSRRRLKFQKLRDFVRSEYDHSCLRSCRSRALYEGLKVHTLSIRKKNKLLIIVLCENRTSCNRILGHLKFYSIFYSKIEWKME